MALSQLDFADRLSDQLRHTLVVRSRDDPYICSRVNSKG